MVPIAFVVLSAAASGFLIYALAQFRREYMRLRRSSLAAARPVAIDYRRVETALSLARMHSHGRQRQLSETPTETVMRREVLTGAVVGLVCLLAPFIFVMLVGAHAR